jgi:hypothetical protein
VAEQLAKYSTLVYPSNRHSGYGKPVTVYAASTQEAINRAVDIGWNGDARDARVKIQSVEDIDPRECPHVTEAHS